MKTILLIIVVMNCLDSFCQQQYKIDFTTNAEIGVVNYKIEQSQDTVHWNVLATINPTKKPDSNKYSYPLPFINAYVRVNANMIKGNYYTPKFLIASTPNVVISNTAIQNKVLQWNTTNEANVKYYSIEESILGVIWTETQQVQPKGDSQYKITVK